jgi:nucleoid DNA-binding protein
MLSTSLVKGRVPLLALPFSFKRRNRRITSALKKGDSISLMGFGSFKVVERAAREGRNPSTGKKMQIPASKGVKFTPGANLKERVNK